MTQDEMIALTEGVAIKADKMRLLERHGIARADIARFLGVRYQQVRNTLEGDKRTGYSPDLDKYDSSSAQGDDPAPGDGFAILQTSADGGAVLPPALLDAIPGASDAPVYAVRMKHGLFVTSLAGAMAVVGQSGL